MDSNAAPSSPEEEMEAVHERTTSSSGANGNTGAGHATDATDVEVFPQHEECTAILTMKCGEPRMAVRKKLHDEIAITFIPEEGFGVFQSKVERHFSKIGPTYVQEQRAIYLKPSSNATQSKYVQLTKENFDTVLRMRWKVARSMKVDFKYEVFCYFVDTSSKKEKKRLSLLKSQQQLQQQQTPTHPSHRFLEHTVAQASATAAQSATTASAAHSVPGSHAASASATSSTPASAQPSGTSEMTPVFPLVAPTHPLLAQSISQAIQTYADMSASMMEQSLKRPAPAPAASTYQHEHLKKQQSSTHESNVPSPERSRKHARTSASPTRKPGSRTQDHHHTHDGDETEHELQREPLVQQFYPIPVRINGIVVPIEVDVAALRRGIGLPESLSE